ncbi:MAG: DUF1592 domain-containing protein [Myxococcales bacterium]|nr:DUF1592 domain-containing protein [Myxococcales bacterium]MCB9717971.1 DUF1592 domain-containing protein [Myxococcales bacterium]
MRARRRGSRAIPGAVALALCGACYSGVGSFEKQGVPLWDDHQADDDDDDEPISELYSPDPGQIRLLSAHEYANTVRDLLGVEASSDLDYGEIGSGFDNGSGGQLDENLFGILHREAERLAEQYVGTGGLAAAFPCFTPGQALDQGCAETIVDGLGRRAFRRPVDAQTRDQLLAFVSQARDAVDTPTQLAELLVTRMLMSPRFLYRSEIGVPLDDDPSMTRLDPFEKASLLSYSLVGSMPDEALLADAEADRLDSERTREHVRRLLATDPGRAQLVRFFVQWLRADALETMVRSPESYPKLSGLAQAQALRDELTAFVETVVIDERGTLAELLTRNLAFVNRHTAALYGASSDAEELEPLVLDPQQRGGVLTLASVMAVHSSSAEVHRDKPIRRGLLVKNQLLCEDVGLPSGIDIQSAAEDAMDEVPDFEQLTTREQLEIITSQDPICEACHATFMPYGYLWSNFDALGQYQTHFGDRLLDAYVEDLQLDGELRAYDGVMAMLPELVDGQQLPRCFGRNVARYASGLADGEIVDHLGEVLTADHDAHDLDILALVEDLFATPELYIREAP